MLKIMSVVFLFLCLNNAFSQDIDYSEFKGESFKAGIDVRLDKPYFKEYGYPVLDQYILLPTNNREELQGKPECVLNDIILSASGVLNYFLDNVDSKVDDYKRPVDLLNTANFFLLRHKLSFTRNGNEIAVIKYTQFIDSIAIQDFSIQCIRYENEDSWKGMKNKDINHIEYALLNITAGEFWSLIKSRELDENDVPVPEELRQELKDDEGVLNLYKLSAYLRERQSKGKKGLLD